MEEDLAQRRHHCRVRASFVVRPELRFYNHHITNTSTTTGANNMYGLPTLALECNLFIQQDAWRKSPIDNPSQLVYLNEFHQFETNSFSLKLCHAQYTSQDMLFTILEQNLINWDEYYDSINENLIKRMVFRIHERLENEFNKGTDSFTNSQDLDMFMDMTLKLEYVLDGRVERLPWHLSFYGVVHGGMVPASKTSIMELPERMEIDDDQCLKDTDCVICLEQLEGGAKIVCMPCSHMFHQDCIKTWLAKSHYCPICRYDMPTALKPRP